MAQCDTCPSKDNCSKSESECTIQSNPLNNVKNIIGVMSGKGGVGKSTVSVMLAKQLKQKGYSVGVLDADITGPSTVRLLGLTGQRAVGNKDGIFPVETNDGIRVMSLNLMIDDENQPVIWRGSLLSGAVKQFWTDVIWGNLDYLIIDMPPGTGDITLTVMQSIPISGVVMVSIPQDMVSMIVTKSINMAKKMNVNIYGIVENMSYILCPHCNEKINLFDNKNISKFLEETQTELLGTLPTTENLCNISSNGFSEIPSEIKETFDNIINKINNFNK